MQHTLENFLGQWVFEETLNGPAHWSRAVLRVVALLHEEFLRRVIELKLEVFLAQPCQNFLHLQTQNLDEIRLRE